MLTIIDPGPLTTIQDLGRFGFARFGVPVSGAMDMFALRAANLLVGNEANAAGLEVGIGDLMLEATDDCVLAAAGAGYDLFVNGRLMPLWMSILCRRGSVIEMRKSPGGCWGYVAVAGGIVCEPVLGSRATFVRGALGGLNGGPLRGGDTLPVGAPSQSPWQLAGREIPEMILPKYGEAITVDVIIGPQAERFADEGLRVFLSSEYAVSATSDRMGYRLQGATIAHRSGADIVSDGMVRGSAQVPASGEPMVMMADGPTTGGYPKIATVVSADFPALAQCAPGAGRVGFRATTVEAAQARYRAMMNGLRVIEPDDD
ncbi:MAG: biotin-dependent carboxyltransferase family protein [Chloroflexi bacterium]|nr:biotin-dependent carboxyltransferase family protein [Chloroflexota bacterium]